MERIWLGVMIAALVAGLAGDARAAEPVPEATVTQARPSHLVYASLLGKGGLWALGYEYRFAGVPLAVGGAASASQLDGQRVLSFSPYVSYTVLERGRHAWFVDGGPQLVHVATPSPVPEWSGTSSTGVGAQVSSGWAHRTDRGWLVRTYALVVAGKGGVAPWLGVDLGWSF